MNPGSVPSDVAAVRGPGIYKHGSVTVCIVPLAAVLNPAAAQVSIHSKAVPGTVYLNPAAYRITSVFKLEPFSTLVDAPVVALSGGEILSTVRWHPRPPVLAGFLPVSPGPRKHTFHLQGRRNSCGGSHS